MTRSMDEDRGEAALRAMFAEAERPPLGDERFVAEAMAGVRRRVARDRAQASAAFVFAAALGVVGVAMNAGDLIGAAADIAAQYGAGAPQLSMGAVGLLVAAAAASIGFVAAER